MRLRDRMYPTCKIEALTFNITTSCAENPTFIISCGACQTCVLTYSIEHPDVDTDEKEITPLISSQLNKCLNMPGGTEVQQYSIQVSNLTALHSWIVGTKTSIATEATARKKVLSTTTGSISSVTPSSWTSSLQSDSEDWSTILSTATWASAYFSALSAASISAMKASSRPSTPTPTITPETSSSSTGVSNSTIPLISTTSASPLNKSWIIGPIIGSLLGMSTVFIVIFFTRRKQHRDFLFQQPLQQHLHQRHIPIDIGPYKSGLPTKE
ncbi:hypothetical protein SBOR_9630 [Sclerotinia borealis F-4128]|uniref:Uncharacterized protein n=1 Tax=Sclerotinia borealis (strain F-4128) TaxID=1432307 RepID=W9BZI4_SCLBF|nr:hypothetical protein SBOR_9630 [Sclerotinia borealis F-4128]